MKATLEFKTLGAVRRELAAINKQLENINVKLSELATSLNEVGDKLDKAKAEILAQIEKLEAADPDLSPEGQAAVERLREVAEALDAVVEDEAPPA